VLVLPSIVALVLLGVILGLTLKSHSGASVQGEPAASGSALPSEISKATQSRPPIEPVRQETLTVDMLPLVPSGQSVKGPAEVKRAAPGTSATTTNAAKASRDYGI